MIGRKNKGPSLAIATAALGGTGGVLGSGFGGILGYLAGVFEPLGGLIAAALGWFGTTLAGSLGSLASSFGPASFASGLDSLSSLGITSLPSTPISNIVTSIPTSIFPFI